MTTDRLQPGIPKGTRDFSPEEMMKRKYILRTIEEVFQRYGYLPIETPAMENLGTLTGKYGEEGDKLIFRILNSGDFMKEANHEDINALNSKRLSAQISEKALRYDLTVPFARYVALHRNEITFPFKRYQMQPVWRADRPQKGRYREFWQCDADVIGSDSLMNEVEQVQMMAEVLQRLRIPYRISLNSRKVLNGIIEALGFTEKNPVDVFITLDKIEKIGDAAYEELLGKGYTKDEVAKLKKPVNELLSAKHGQERTSLLRKILKNHKAGVDEVEYVFNKLAITAKNIISSEDVFFDIALARGLDYYTGIILEAKAEGVEMGSIAGGGRYDNLTGAFGLPGISGVGFSFGVDRICDVMNELKLFPENIATGTQVLFACFDEASIEYALPLLAEVRSAGISAEIYPSPEKIKKQMKYADDKKIPYVALIGTNEMQTGKLTLKNMKDGIQKEVRAEELVKKLNENRKEG